MNSTQKANPYEHLKLDTLTDVEPVPAQSTWTITEGQEEQVTILAAELPSGGWCYGYSVYWKNGRHSYSNPDPSMGLFRTEREAQLYTLGFMSLFTSYFTDATNRAILSAIGAKSQGSLF